MGKFEAAKTKPQTLISERKKKEQIERKVS